MLLRSLSCLLADHFSLDLGDAVLCIFNKIKSIGFLQFVTFCLIMKF